MYRAKRTAYYDILRRFRKYCRRLQRVRHDNSNPRQAARTRALLINRIKRLAARLNPLGKRSLGLSLVAAICAGFGADQLTAQIPTISSLAPTANARAAATDATIEIGFSTSMNISTLTAAHIRIYGSQSGFLSTRGSFSGNPLRSFDPDNNFRPGELISVSVTGATSLGGTQLTNATVYSFFAAAQSGTAQFSRSTLGGHESLGVAIGDLDGDGNLDAILAGFDSNELWLGNGDGSFATSTVGGAGSNFSDKIALGDLDADGDLDAIVANNFGDQHEIWLNNGDASFATSTFGTGRSTGLAIGDLDGDGDLDALITIFNGLGHEIWLNNGDGSFTSSTFGLSDSEMPALGDLDGDGDLDAIIANTNEPQHIWLNNGDATFTSTAVGSGDSECVALGDLDGDGDLDAIITNDDEPQDIWLNNGDGTFSSTTFGGGDSEMVALGDLDADGDLDALICDNSGQNHIWLNNGDGSFASSAFGGGESEAVALGDLDGDGDLDAIFANREDQANAIWLNGSVFSRITGLAPAANSNNADQAADIDITFSTTMNVATLNADGIRVYGSQSGFLSTTASFSGNPVLNIDPADNFKPGELISVTVTGATSQIGDLPLQSPQVYTFRAGVTNGNASFVRQFLGEKFSSYGVAIGDLDGDGDLDAIVANYYAPKEIWLGNGDGSFSTSTFGSDSDTRAVAIGDLDGDGDLDAIFSVYYGYAPEIWINNGDASFSSFTFGEAGGSALAIGDLDGDGDLDAIITDYYGYGHNLWLNNGDASFSSSTFPSTDAEGIVLGDLDGDGDLDAIITNDDGPSNVLTNNGDASFVTNSPAGGDHEGLALGDIDGDGDLDAIIAGEDEAQAIWRNNGDATFTTASFGSPDGNSEAVALGDLDGDGDLDAIIVNDGGPQEIWVNNGDGSFSSSTRGGGRSNGIELGDLDGDGDLDAIIASYNYSQQAIWINSPIVKITSVAPASNATAVAQDADVDISFSTTMNVSTLGAGNIKVFGSQTGRLSGSFSGNPLRNFDPSADFKPGELISVSVDDVLSQEGHPLQDPKVFSFRAAVDNGPGTFAPRGFGGLLPSYGIAAGDLDGDGDLDAVVANGYYYPQDIWLNNGDGTFSISTFGDGDSDKVLLGDLDCDGDLDAIVVAVGESGHEIWLGNGDGTFSSSSFGEMESIAAALGDLDGDGDLDVALGGVGPTESSEIWLNNGDGSFTISEVSFGFDGGLAIGDLNGDGLLDVMAAKSGPPQQLWLNQGDASFSEDFFLPPSDGEDVALGDLDGDGDLDAIIAVYDDPQWLLLNNGDATFTASMLGGGDSRSVDMGDVDGDGDLDAIIVNQYQPDELWTNNGDGSFAISTFGNSSGASFDLALGDIDGDGDLDILVAQSYYQPQEILFNAGPPQIANLIPDNSCPTASALGVAVVGENLYSTTAEVTVRNLQNTIITSATLADATPESATLATLTLPAGFMSTAGTITIGFTTPTGSTSTTFTVGVIANLDFATTTEFTTVTLAVLANDNGSGLQLVSVADPANGSASTNAGLVSYTPDPAFTGQETFTYTVENDGGCRSTGAIVVAVLAGQALPGNMEFVEREKDRKGGVRGLRRASAVAVSPDGKHLYAAGRSDHSVAIFDRAAETGELSYSTRIRDGFSGVTGIRFANSVAISADGRHLYVAGYGSNAIAVFERNAVSGLLSFVEQKKQGGSDAGGTINGLLRPVDVAVSTDGKNVYAVGYAGHSLAAFSRDPLSGALIFQDWHKDGVDGVDGLRNAFKLHVSPDGRSVYVAGYRDNALALFKRDLVSGALEFVEHYVDGVDGIDGLRGATSVVVSPDSRHVYATANADNALAVFSRNTASGRLSFVERQRDGSSGVDGLRGAFNVAVSPDGANVYAVGELDHALTMFRRNLSSGSLSFEERERDGSGGVDGLNRARGLAVSPDSKYMYCAGWRDNAIAVFFRNRAPIAVDDLGLSVLPNDSLVISPRTNDSDPDSHILTISGKTDGALGTVTIGGGTTVTYKAGAVPGSDSFSYTIEDGHGGSSTATVNISVVAIKLSLGNDQLPATEEDAGQSDGVDFRVAPNPFSDEVRIGFRLARASRVELQIVDLLGNVVQQFSDAALAAGEHSIVWDGGDLSGGPAAAGAYTAQLVIRDGDGRVERRSLSLWLLR